MESRILEFNKNHQPTLKTISRVKVKWGQIQSANILGWAFKMNSIFPEHEKNYF